MSLRGALANNLSLKIAATVVAVVVWLFAKGEQSADRAFSVPLVLRSVPEGVTTVERLPESIEVVLSGDNKNLVRLGIWGEPYAFVDMTDAKPDRTLRVSLSQANVVLPYDSGLQILEIRDPKTLDLEIDRLEERRVRVDPALRGSLGEGYYFLGTPTTVPDSVNLYGPARIIRDLASATTSELDISGRRARVEAARPIDLGSRWNLHAVPKEVRIIVDVEGTSVERIADIPVRFDREPGFASTTIEPLAAQVQVSGPKHIIDGVTAADVSVVVDARGLPRGVHRLVPDVRTPDGVAVTGVTPQRFTVTLE